MVVDVAAVLFGLTGDVSVRSVAFGDCSNYCSMFSGEQSDRLVFCSAWWSPALLEFVSFVGGCVQGGAVKLSRPLGLGVALVSNVLWWSAWSAVRPLRAAKRAAQSSRPSWVVNVMPARFPRGSPCSDGSTYAVCTLRGHPWVQLWAVNGTAAAPWFHPVVLGTAAES